MNNNLYQKKSSSKNSTVLKKMGLFLLVFTIIIYLILSINYLIN